MRRIYGIDFSGAKDAGKKIWISSGVKLEKCLQIDECYPASTLHDSGEELDLCLPALRKFIAKQTDAAFGLDFPFGLPEPFVNKLFGEVSWKEFSLSFQQRFQSIESFRDGIEDFKKPRQVGKKELWRTTDKYTKTPFCAYNRWIYRQTYYGITRLLSPLVQEDAICALPMQCSHKNKRNKPLILEICPASTLKSLNQYYRYKGNKGDRKKNRKKILSSLEDSGMLAIKDLVVRAKIIEDRGGDALDSAIAAFETYRALKNEYAHKSNCYNPLEGYVYLDKGTLGHELVA
jgi:hypothetical protein